MDLTNARLVYLLSKHSLAIPRPVLKYLPGGEWLSQLQNGLGSAATMLDVPLAQLNQIYKQGESLGPGSDAEARDIIADLVDAEVQRKDLDLDVRVRIYAELERFLTKTELVEETEVDLSLAEIPDSIPKFQTGFEPLDMVLGGMYQGLVILMARPGTGKTSVMLSIMEAAVCSGIPTVFVESEISQQMMLGRMRFMLKRTAFTPRDRLICGGWSAREVLDYVREFPNPDRIVFFDGPDVVGGSSADDRRFVLERAYQDLVRVKQLSRAVIVSSQPRRNDGRLSITSTAESWAKAWYADAIVGIEAIHGLDTRLRLRTIKNRFGPSEQQVTFKYNLMDLSWESPMELDDEEW